MYRLPQSWVGPKLPWKIGHAVLHLLAFILTVLGLVVVFQFHNHENTVSLYSLHSWLGIVTVFLFACQVGPLLRVPAPRRRPWAPVGTLLASAPNTPSGYCPEMALQGASHRIGSLSGGRRLVVPTPVPLPLRCPSFIIAHTMLMRSVVFSTFPVPTFL